MQDNKRYVSLQCIVLYCCVVYCIVVQCSVLYCIYACAFDAWNNIWGSTTFNSVKNDPILTTKISNRSNWQGGVKIQASMPLAEQVWILKPRHGVLTWEGTQCVKNKNALIVSPRQLKIDEQMSSCIEFWMRWEWWWCLVWIVPHLFPFGSSTLKCETWSKLEAKMGTFEKKVQHMRKEQFKWRGFVLFAPTSRGSFIYIKIAMVKAPSRTILFLSGIFCRIQNVLRLVLGTASHQVGVFD